jgi:drug/metabolite transporter (DMT)-like permease
VASLFALLSSALWGTSDFLGGTAARKITSVAVVTISSAFGLIGVVVAAVLVGSFGAPTGYVGWGLLGAVAGTVALTSFYRALATGTMGVVAPIAALGVIVPLVVGLATGDRPDPAQVVGVAVAIFGVVLASGPELASRGSAGGGAQSLALAVIAAVGFGVVYVSLANGAKSSTVMTLLVMRTASLAMIFAVAMVTGGEQLKVGVRTLPVLAVVGAFDVGANATFAWASQHGLLSLVSVLASLYPAVTVVLARVVHAERLRSVQLAGVLSALVGVVLIAS